MKSRMTATLAVRGGGEWFEAQTCRGAFLVAPVVVHALVQCYTGTMHTEATMVHWCIGTVYNWYSGSVVQWYTGTLVHIGTLVHYWYRQWWHQGSTLRQGQQHVRREGGLDSWFLVHIPPLGNILCRHEYQLITDCKRLRKKSSM